MLLSQGVRSLSSILLIVAGALSITNQSSAAPVKILADTHFLKSLGIKPISSDPFLQLSVAEVSEYQAETISHSAHQYGKCGGFERLDTDSNIQVSFDLMRYQASQAVAFEFVGSASPAVEKKTFIENATQQVSEDNLREMVQWLSSYHTRFHRVPESNKHVEDLAEKARQLLANLPYPYQVDLIQHTKTPQKTLRVRLQGREYPNEVVVLGAHLDSINGPIPTSKAPGADDNASGSSNIFEALRIASMQEQPLRSIEFFWYAAEEIGLVGSSEIAQSYKQANVDVVGVMQLDMTLFPGEGELVMGDLADFTNPWLRNYLKTLNSLYVGAQWKTTECGYGCSDHASWHRQGYAAAAPFEATLNTMNKNIHTNKDVISPALNFKHSAAFAKLAVAYALDYANSSLRPTF